LYPDYPVSIAAHHFALKTLYVVVDEAKTYCKSIEAIVSIVFLNLFLNLK